MILSVASFLVAFGFLAFIVGNVTGYHELSVIGGTIILGVGVMVTTSGVEYKSGVEKVEVNNTTVVENQYRHTNTPQHLPLGFVVMLLASAMILRSIDEFS